MVAPGAVADLVYLWDGRGQNERRLLAIRSDTGQVVATVVDVPDLWSPNEAARVAFAADGARLYVDRGRRDGENWTSTVEEYDATRATLIRTLVPTRVAVDATTSWSPDNVDQMLPSPDGKWLYLLRRVYRDKAWHDMLETIDLATGVMTNLLSFGDERASGAWLEAQLGEEGHVLYVHRVRNGRYDVAGSDLLTVDLLAHKIARTRSWDTSAGMWSASAGPSWCFGWHVAPDGQTSDCPTWRGDVFGVEVEAAPDWAPVALIPLPNQPPREQGPGETNPLYAPDGRALFYVAGWGDRREVAKVDLAARRLVATAPLGSRGERAASVVDRLAAALAPVAAAKDFLPAAAILSPDGRRLYASGIQVVPSYVDARGDQRDDRGDGIWVLDGGDLHVLAHFVPGQELWGNLALSPDGRRLYAVDWTTASLLALDAGSGKALARWTGIAPNPEAIEAVVSWGGGR